MDRVNYRNKVTHKSQEKCYGKFRKALSSCSEQYTTRADEMWLCVNVYFTDPELCRLHRLLVTESHLGKAIRRVREQRRARLAKLLLSSKILEGSVLILMTAESLQLTFTRQQRQSAL